MTTPLRGPADADHYRVKIGRYGDRWYTDPLPACGIATAAGPDQAWPSVSSVKKADTTDWTFVGLKRVAHHLQDKPDDLTGLDYDTCYDRLKSINKMALQYAGNRGTQVHTYLENALNGRPLEQTPFDHPEGATYLPALRAFFDTYKPGLVAAELVCINRHLGGGVGYGGTGDAIITLNHPDIPPGPYWVDWKSRGQDSDHGAYPDEAAQLGAYHSADYYIAENGGGARRVMMPPVAGGLIVSIRPDGFRLYPIDLDKAAAHWARLHQWWVAKRDERDAVGRPWAPQTVPGDDTLTADLLSSLIATADDVDELTAIWEEHATVWTAEHTNLAKARKTLLTTATTP